MDNLHVFVTSPWVPAEWVEAHGLELRGAWFETNDEPVAVPEGACAFAQAMLKLARAHSQPAVIFTTACDQMRRATDEVAGRCFLFNLPATWQSPTSRRLYHAELARLGTFLEAHGGCAPTEARLTEVMLKYETRRGAFREFMTHSAARRGVEALAGFHTSDVLPALPAAPVEVNETQVSLALVGGPFLPSQWPLLDAIENAGGRVVLNATEPGERSLLPPLVNATSAQSPFAVLANHYFDHIVDVFPRPNSRLYEWLGPRLTQRRVRGIVLWVHVGCDLWRAEAASLREKFGLPLLVLESHEIHAGGLRDSNRLAAFIESLQ